MLWKAEEFRRLGPFLIRKVRCEGVGAAARKDGQGYDISCVTWPFGALCMTLASLGGVSNHSFIGHALYVDENATLVGDSELRGLELQDSPLCFTPDTIFPLFSSYDFFALVYWDIGCLCCVYNHSFSIKKPGMSSQR